jgi:hypothetical protein
MTSEEIIEDGHKENCCGIHGCWNLENWPKECFYKEGEVNYDCIACSEEV